MKGIYIRTLEFTSRDREEWIHTEDGYLDDSTYKPADPADFYLDVNIALSWVGFDVIWRFYVYVFSPKAMLSGKLKEDKIFSGRHYIIMQEYDEPALKAFLESYVADLEDLPFTQQIERMCRLGQWEAEDSRWDSGAPFVTHDIIFHDENFILEDSNE